MDEWALCRLNHTQRLTAFLKMAEARGVGRRPPTRPNRHKNDEQEFFAQGATEKKCAETADHLVDATAAPVGVSASGLNVTVRTNVALSPLSWENLSSAFWQAGRFFNTVS